MRIFVRANISADYNLMQLALLSANSSSSISSIEGKIAEDHTHTLPHTHFLTHTSSHTLTHTYTHSYTHSLIHTYVSQHWDTHYKEINRKKS